MIDVSKAPHLPGSREITPREIAMGALSKPLYRGDYSEIRYMDNNDKTLAEYLEILKSRSASKPLSVTVDNASYNMYYSATAEAVVPTKYSYTVSGDNMNGYIITVDKTSATSAQ